jgi:hypothetical protein
MLSIRLKYERLLTVRRDTPSIQNSNRYYLESTDLFLDYPDSSLADRRWDGGAHGSSFTSDPFGTLFELYEPQVANLYDAYVSFFFPTAPPSVGSVQLLMADLDFYVDAHLARWGAK